MQKTIGGKLPRTARLRGHDTFGRLFREGDGLRRGELVVKYKVSEHGETGVRAGFVVRRSAGSNVRRNRLKRLLREAYRVRRNRFADSLPQGIALDLVILWSGSPEQALRPDFDAIGTQMDAALRTVAARLRKRADGTAEQR